MQKTKEGKQRGLMLRAKPPWAQIQHHLLEHHALQMSETFCVDEMPCAPPAERATWKPSGQIQPAWVPILGRSTVPWDCPVL